MSQKIVIDPVTRIEGHAKITIQLDDAGEVQDAAFHVTQYRGFEKFIQGRPFHEMPGITARICGICPVSHIVSSAKACDNIMAVKIPPTADKLRRVMNLAQHLQSHALSFFHLSSPDLLLGMDADPAIRNVFGVIQSHPSLALDGIKLRKYGQQIIEWVAKKRIHPSWTVPGGVNNPLTPENRELVMGVLPDAMAIITRTLDWFKAANEKYKDEIEHFANFPTMFMGMVDENGNHDIYDGVLRMVDAKGDVVAEGLQPENYSDFIGEAVESNTYLKFPYYKPMGYPQGIYRVGPLARLNVCKNITTPKARKEWQEFKPGKEPVQSSFHYHMARLIEILHDVEEIERHMNDPEITGTHIRSYAGVNSLEGIGASEAPRGTLFHHYKVDENGTMQWANMIIATGHNNLAMNAGVKQVAKRWVKGPKVSEGALNRVEAVIRAFDPCLSCSTHAVGKMPMHVEVLGPDGELLNTVTRG